MPLYRQVEVEVLGERGQPLREYGETKNARMKLVSCFIQSEIDKRFRIRITPGEELLRADDDTDADSLEVEDGFDDEFELLGESPGKSHTPPWHLLATLKLDGRPEIERRAYVRLNCNDEFFNGEGAVVLRGTMARDEDGHSREYEWVFKDVGIDVAFDNLALGGIDQGTMPAQAEAELVEALGTMGTSNTVEKYEAGKVGQIQLRLDRVTLCETVKSRFDMIGHSRDLTPLDGSAIGDAQHTVGRAEGKRMRPAEYTTYYEYLDKDGEPYAIFRFNYCEEKKLRKLGLLDPLTTPQISNKRSEALKMAAAVQRKLKPAISYKFLNMEAAEAENGHDGDNEQSEDGEVSAEEDEGEGPSEDRPLGDLGDKLGELGMDRTRKRDEDTEEESGKKAKAE